MMILGSSLLFNQIGLHFFHNAHDAHEYFSAAKKNQTILLNHGEHCEVCSLEVLFNIVLPVSTELPSQTFSSAFVDQSVPESVLIYRAHSQGRAPPVSA